MFIRAEKRRLHESRRAPLSGNAPLGERPADTPAKQERPRRIPTILNIFYVHPCQQACKADYSRRIIVGKEARGEGVNSILRKNGQTNATA